MAQNKTITYNGSNSITYNGSNSITVGSSTTIYQPTKTYVQGTTTTAGTVTITVGPATLAGNIYGNLATTQTSTATHSLMNTPVLFIETKLTPGKLYKSNFDFCIRNCKFVLDKGKEYVNIQFEYDNFVSKDLLLFVKTSIRYLTSEIYYVFMTPKGNLVGFRKPAHNSYESIVVLEELK